MFNNQILSQAVQLRVTCLKNSGKNLTYFLLWRISRSRDTGSHAYDTGRAEIARYFVRLHSDANRIKAAPAYISTLNSNFAHRSFCINGSRLKESAWRKYLRRKHRVCQRLRRLHLTICPTLFQHSPSPAVLPTLAERRGVNTKPFGTSELNSKFTPRQCGDR